MEPIFTTSYLGSSVTVYQNMVEWKMAFKKQSVPISNIASVEVGMPMYAQVVIETTGGKKLKMPVAPGQKTKLRDAIYQAQGSINSPVVIKESSHLDELGKLGDLKEKGIITEEEFSEKKKKLLDQI